jgi:hypothetical protein
LTSARAKRHALPLATRQLPRLGARHNLAIAPAQASSAAFCRSALAIP